MADLNLGRTMLSNNGSLDSLLRSVKQQIDLTKFKGKVNDDAINAILLAIATQQENQGKYLLELASKNNDAIVDKIKDALEKLYEALLKADSGSSASSKDNNGLVDDIVADLKKELAKLLQTKDTTSESKEATETDLKKLQDTLDDIKSTLGQNTKVEASVSEKLQNGSKNEISAEDFNANKADYAAQVDLLKTHIDKVFKQLNDTLQPIAFSPTKIFKHISASINGTIASISSLGKNIIGKINAPFKGLSNKLKEIGTSLKDGFKNVLGSVSGALKSMALAPFKLVGGLVSKLNPFKRKKKPTKDEIKLSKMIDKVNNFIDNFFDNMLGYVEKFVNKALKFAKKAVNVLMTHIFVWLLANVVLIGLIFGLILKLISKPLMEILLPIMDFVDDIFTKLITFLTPVRDFLLNVLQDTWNIIKTPFEGLMKGIGNVAEALGTALGKLIIGIADFMVDTLLPFLRDHLLPIYGAILDIIKLFFEAMKPWIEPLVNVVMAALVAIIPILQRLVMEVGEILIDIAKIIHAPIKFIADFFEGFNTNAKKIGEKVSEVVLTTLDIVLEGLKLIRDNLGNLFDLIKLYVIAPLKALLLKVRSALSKLADYDGIGSGVVHAIANAFGWGSLSDKEKVEARNASEKSVGELIADEMSKMQANIDADKAAREAANLAKQLQLKLIENLLANQHKIDDILAIAISNNEYLVEIGKQFGIELEPPKIEVAPPKVDMTAPEIDTEELNTSSNDTASRIDKLTDLVQPLPLYMKMCMSTIQQNLDSILDKLDDKPNLIPIPMMNPTEGNMAIMENR